MSASPTITSRVVGRAANNSPPIDSPCARKKKRMSDTSRTVSASVSAKRNGGLNPPSSSRGRMPKLASTAITTSCVGKPEQRMTSSAAAARSMGRTRGAPIGESPIGAPGSTNAILLFRYRDPDRERGGQLHRERRPLRQTHLFPARRQHIAGAAAPPDRRTLPRGPLAAGDPADHRARRGRPDDLQGVLLLGRASGPRDRGRADARGPRAGRVELRKAYRDVGEPLNAAGATDRGHVAADRRAGRQ